MGQAVTADRDELGVTTGHRGDRDVRGLEAGGLVVGGRQDVPPLPGAVAVPDGVPDVAVQADAQDLKVSVGRGGDGLPAAGEAEGVARSAERGRGRPGATGRQTGVVVGVRGGLDREVPGDDLPLEFSGTGSVTVLVDVVGHDDVHVLGDVGVVPVLAQLSEQLAVELPRQGQQVVVGGGGEEPQGAERLDDRRVRYGAGGVDDALQDEEPVGIGPRGPAEDLVAAALDRVVVALAGAGQEDLFEDVLPVLVDLDVASPVGEGGLPPGPAVAGVPARVDEDGVLAGRHELVVGRGRRQRVVGQRGVARTTAQGVGQEGQGLLVVGARGLGGCGGDELDGDEFARMAGDPGGYLTGLAARDRAVRCGPVEEEPPSRSAVVRVPGTVDLAQPKIEVACSRFELTGERAALGAGHAGGEGGPLAGDVGALTVRARAAVLGDAPRSGVVAAGHDDAVERTVADGTAQLLHP